jgi:hypothetical protein
MEWSPSWEANSSLANQDILHILWNAKIYYFVHNIPPLFLILSQINPVCTFPAYFFKINCNIILLSMCQSSKWSLSFSFLHHNTLCISSLHSVCQMSCQSHAFWCGQLNKALWVQRTSGIARFRGSWGEWSQSQPLTKIMYFQKIASIVKFLLVWLNNLKYVECRKTNFVITMFVLSSLKLINPPQCGYTTRLPPPPHTLLQIKKLCSMLFPLTFCYFVRLRPIYFPQHRILGTPKACFLHNDKDRVSHPYNTVSKIIVFMLIFVF